MERTPTILDALRGVSAYPIPPRTIMGVAAARGIADVWADADTGTTEGAAFRLATADLLWWLALAPDVSQGGQSYSLTDEQRKRLRQMAQEIYDELEDGDDGAAGVYGYKGSRL